MLNEVILNEMISIINDDFVSQVTLGEAVEDARLILVKQRVEENLFPNYIRQAIVQSLFSIDNPELEGALSLF